MPTSSKAIPPSLTAPDPHEFVLEDEEALAAALNEAARTGAPISADAELLARFGIADHGEDLGDLDLVFPDRAS